MSFKNTFGITFVLIDDWYNSIGEKWLNRTVGSKPTFSDSEVLTLMMAIDYFEFTSERRFISFVKSNYSDFFPRLVSQSQFNRRSRSLCFLLNYFGYKLVILCTLSGIPYSFELVPASTDERVAADEILDTLPNHNNLVLGDKGFIGKSWQREYAKKGIKILTPKRKNQSEQNSKYLDRTMSKFRERIESLFDILKEGGRSVEKSLARTVERLCSRITVKV